VDRRGADDARGQCFRIKHRSIIGSRRGWAPTGQLRFTVDDVRRMLGPGFARLEEVLLSMPASGAQRHLPINARREGPWM
jgi:hypothetical protein